MKIQQQGRSMVEIIGVLAVMGVLSIAVLYLYPYLVAHHKSNETWNDVLVQAAVVQTSHTDDTFAAIEIVDGEELPSLITSEEFKTSAVGYSMEVYKTNDVQFIVQVDDVDYDVCEIMLKKHSLVPDAIEVGNSKFEPIEENYNICGTSGTKTMYFYFGFCRDDVNAPCGEDCVEPFECFCGRCWCPIVGADPQTCQCPKNYEVIKGECVCPTGDLTTEDVCCPKGWHADGEICCEDGQYNSDGICCPVGQHADDGICCPDGWLDDEEQHRLWIADEVTGECICQRPCDNGFVLNETNCTCECEEGKFPATQKDGIWKHISGEEEPEACLPLCQNKKLFFLIDTSASMCTYEKGIEDRRDTRMNAALQKITIPENIETALYTNDVGNLHTGDLVPISLLPLGIHNQDDFSLWFDNNCRMLEPSHEEGGQGTYFSPSLKEISTSYCQENEQIIIVLWTDGDLEGTEKTNVENILKTMDQNCNLTFFFVGLNNTQPDYIEIKNASFFTFESEEINLANEVNNNFDCISEDDNQQNNERDDPESYICSQLEKWTDKDPNYGLRLLKEQCTYLIDNCPTISLQWTKPENIRGLCKRVYETSL